MTEKRVPFDLDAYVARTRTGPCFVCRIVRGEHDLPTHVVHRDDAHIAFLPNFQVLLGYVLVAPVEHREAVVDDFGLHEYLALQSLVHRVGRALSATVATERLYVVSVGSQQGNRHVHWHVASLPPGVPYEQQQFHALMSETKGVLDLSDADKDDLAERLRAAIAAV